MFSQKRNSVSRENGFAEPRDSLELASCCCHFNACAYLVSSHVYKRYLLLYVIDMPVVSVSSTMCSTYLFLSANFFRPRPHINLICRSSHYSQQILRAPTHTHTPGEKPKSVHFIKIKCKKGQNESEKCAAIARVGRDESIFPFVLYRKSSARVRINWIFIRRKASIHFVAHKNAYPFWLERQTVYANSCA